MLTVVQTLRLQERRVIDYLADAITALRQGLPAAQTTARKLNGYKK
jgi:hypothetical protein